MTTGNKGISEIQSDLAHTMSTLSHRSTFYLTDLRIVADPLAVRKTNVPLVPFIHKWYHPKWYVNWKQQKLIEEYGYYKEPCVFMVYPQSIGGEHVRNTTPYLICHPSLTPQIREILQNDDFAKLSTLVNRFQ